MPASGYTFDSGIQTLKAANRRKHGDDSYDFDVNRVIGLGTLTSRNPVSLGIAQFIDEAQARFRGSCLRVQERHSVAERCSLSRFQGLPHQLRDDLTKGPHVQRIAG